MQNAPLTPSERVGLTHSSEFKMQRTPELRFSATRGQEPEVVLALL
jgi:hypothetical protein